MELLWGKSNIKKWANVDGKTSQDDIAARLARAIALADERIDNELRNHYTVPFNPVPLEISHLSTQLAAVILFKFPRGLSAGEDESLLISDTQDEVDTTLDRLKRHLLKMSRASDATAAPGVFNTTIATDEA